MSASTCAKKIQCCTHTQGVGESIDATFGALFELGLDKDPASDAEIWSMLEDVDAIIESQKRLQKRQNDFIAKRHKKA